MEIFSRHDNKELETPNKCPKCSVSFADFLQVSSTQLGCYDCGTVFLNITVRKEERKCRIDKLNAQVKAKKSSEPPPQTVEDMVEKIEAEKSKLTCKKCGREFKNKLGLGAHMRAHERNDG